MKEFDHPNVLTLFGVCVDAGPAPYIVMPYMAKGSLLTYLRKERHRILVDEKDDEEDVSIQEITELIIPAPARVVYSRLLSRLLVH